MGRLLGILIVASSWQVSAQQPITPTCISDYQKSEDVESKFYESKVKACAEILDAKLVARCEGEALSQYVLVHKSLLQHLVECKAENR